MNSPIKLVIFDLDGTLIDSLTDLALSTNHSLALHGLSEHPVEQYKQFVGNGLDKLIERALPPNRRDTETRKQVKNDFLNHYTVHLNDHTQPYPGITELLDELKARSVQLAVATNKPQEAARCIVKEKMGSTPFISVLGQTPERAVKPNPKIVFEIMAIANVQPAETLYIGDSGVDMQTARNSGIKGIGCKWGFRSERELIENGASSLIAHPSEILDYLNPSSSFH